MTAHNPPSVTLQRAPTSTLSGNVPGLVGAASDPGWVEATVRRRCEGLLRLLEFITVAPLEMGSVPWVPTIPPRVPATTQATEKTEFVSDTILVAGGPVVPTVVGASTDMSLEVYRGAGDTVFVMLWERVIYGLATLVGTRADAATPGKAPTLIDAVAQVETAGYVPAFILTSRSAWASISANNPTGSLSFAGMPVLLLPIGHNAYVLGPSALYFAYTPAITWQVTQPSIAGVEAAAFAAVVCEFNASAIRAITVT